ncbi:Cache 3/Cache 2 fusion domain-containing protein [Shewanella benthica]|uniref:Methyl-accepting chemotaxis protein n=1 Tax=Shewanella benthica KT99 TaxID=314608 RepID=A9DCC3_9GAMM|nr:Cache 3/Cache 2 fusion domain-containing protein [Shewanella benthica]EDQ00314.1 methyl-accepting chemotaxis protein [Shewanella benthica KT99]
MPSAGSLFKFQPVALIVLLQRLATNIKQYKIGTNGIVFLTDEQGIIKLHPDTGNIGKNIKNLGYIDSDSLLQKQAFSTTEYQDAGTDMLVASRYLPEIGWYLIAQVPHDEIFGALNRATKSVAVMGLIIAILFMVISAWLINRLISPFSELANMLAAIGDGEGDLTLRLDDSRHDEVGDMAGVTTNLSAT